MPDVPPDAKKPTDRPKSAAQREAEGAETVDLHYGGHTFTVPGKPDDWDVDVLEAFENSEAAKAIRMLLGPEQWRTFKADRPKVRDLRALFDEVARTFGFDKAGG